MKRVMRNFVMDRNFNIVLIALSMVLMFTGSTVSI